MCTDVISLRKHLTNALIYVNTTLFTLLHYYMLQSSWGHPQGSTDTFREQSQQSTKYVASYKWQSSVLYVIKNAAF